MEDCDLQVRTTGACSFGETYKIVVFQVTTMYSLEDLAALNFSIGYLRVILLFILL
jgi:hypothetical protein